MSRNLNEFAWLYAFARFFFSELVICRFGQPIKVNWAYASSQREDTSGAYIFVFLFYRSSYARIDVMIILLNSFVNSLCLLLFAYCYLGL